MAHLGTVLVTGSTGRVGNVAIAMLARSGRVNIRATYRNEASIEHLKVLGATEFVKFDLKDPSTWAPAMEGVSRVYSASTDPLIKEHM